MLEIINPNGEVDGESSPRIIVGPAGTFAELSEYESILVDGGIDIHKPTPVSVDEFIANDIPSGQAEERRRVNSKPKWKRSLDIMQAMTKRSSGIIKTKIDDALTKSSSNIRRLIFSAKSGINAFKEAYLASIETDHDASNVPIASPHIAPRRVRSKQLPEKSIATKEDEVSASTARLTDDDTITETEGDASSTTTNAILEPKKVTAVKRFDSFDRRHLRRHHCRHYPCKLSYDFHDGSLCEDEDSVANGSEKSFDSIDSLIRNETCGCDPCGVW